MALYRFNKTEVERLSMLKGEDSWYLVSDGAGEPVFQCHVIGNCLGGTSTFHAGEKDSEVLFEMRPKRKILNLTYFIFESLVDTPLATIRLYAGRGMKVTDAHGRESFEVIDPQGKLDRFMQNLLEGCCSRYAIVAGDRIIGGFERRDRPENRQPEPKGFVRKLFKRTIGSLVRDWCVEIEDGVAGLVDRRVLIATMILLQEQTIRMDQAGG